MSAAKSRHRGNGEGSIYRFRDGWAAYVWVTTPTGKRVRKYVYGPAYDEVRAEWLNLHQSAARGPVATKSPLLKDYLDYWLTEVVRPNLRGKVPETYEMHVRLHITPWIGHIRLDKLTVRDARTWLNDLATRCQCCAQGKDAARPPRKQRCCAIGRCCGQTLSRRTVADVRAVLRSALNTAIADEELTGKNVVAGIRLRKARKRPVTPWTVEEARRFLVSAREDEDPLYVAYVLLLVMGFRRGEVLGLTWPLVNLEAAQLLVMYGLQRIEGQLALTETKTEASDGRLPLPGICLAALRLQEQWRSRKRQAAGPYWRESDYVVTSATGGPMDPRNFHRAFQKRCELADVPRIPVHWTRHTCGSLLAALDVHPRVAMQILRHSKVEITMEIYTHVPTDLTQKALRKLGRHLDVMTGAVTSDARSDPQAGVDASSEENLGQTG